MCTCVREKHKILYSRKTSGCESRTERADELLQLGPEGRVHASDGTGGLSRLPIGGDECVACELDHTHLRVRVSDLSGTGDLIVFLRIFVFIFSFFWSLFSLLILSQNERRGGVH